MKKDKHPQLKIIHYTKPITSERINSLCQEKLEKYNQLTNKIIKLRALVFNANHDMLIDIDTEDMKKLTALLEERKQLTVNDPTFRIQVLKNINAKIDNDEYVDPDEIAMFFPKLDFKNENSTETANLEKQGEEIKLTPEETIKKLSKQIRSKNHEIID